MKFSINQSELVRAITVVLKGVSTRSTLPVLSGILIEAKGDEVLFQSTDLELSVRYRTAALVEEEGNTVVPGRLTHDIVKSLPDAAVSFETANGSSSISCGSTRFSVKTLNSDDFPSFPEVDVIKKVDIPFEPFSSMVRRVARAVSRDESRAILTGILLKVENNTVKMVATDSYRLAISEFTLTQPVEESFEAVISGSFLSDLASLERSEEPISLSLSENQIVVSYQETIFVNRRLEGNFPNYAQLLPSSHDVRIEMDKEKLTAAVKRLAILGSSSSPVRFDINIPSQTAQLSAAQQDIGSASETIPCTGEGEDIEIAFNCSYVLDGLGSIGTDTVFLEAQSPLKPGIFTSGEGEKFLYLVMPVRIA